jgi:flagellar biosynthesis protein FlhG
MTHLTHAQRLLLVEQVDSLEGTFDVLLLDTGAGISPNVLFFASAAQDAMVIVTPEPTALTDAYALVRELATRYGTHRFAVLVNMARNQLEAKKTFTHLSRVAERFLHVSMRYAGHVPWDPEVPNAVCRQRLVVDLAPAAPVSRAFEALAEHVLQQPIPDRPTGRLQFFFRQLLAQARA